MIDNEYFETYGYPPFYEDERMYKMAKVTNEQLYQEIIKIKTILLGVPESEDMGLYGEVRDMKKLQKEINGTVRSDHAWVGALRWTVGLLALALIGAVTTGIIGVW
ncbi:hypothetical protein ES703_45275 [subsurface metagenome]